MTRTFSFLRANDLVYGPAVRSYMMGEAPPAFDLLYWNGDSTNLPGKMAKQYLRGLCQRQQAGRGQPADLFGETLSVDRCRPCRSVRLPVKPTISPPGKTAFAASPRWAREGQDLHLQSESGHIAGHREPADQRRNTATTPTIGRLGMSLRPGLRAAGYTEGSWWPRWEAWVAKKSGAMVRGTGAGRGGLSGSWRPAPGTYVREKYATD